MAAMPAEGKEVPAVSLSVQLEFDHLVQPTGP
jgi:hypothetical protein